MNRHENLRSTSLLLVKKLSNNEGRACESFLLSYSKQKIIEIVVVRRQDSENGRTD